MDETELKWFSERQLSSLREKWFSINNLKIDVEIFMTKTRDDGSFDILVKKLLSYVSWRHEVKTSKRKWWDDGDANGRSCRQYHYVRNPKISQYKQPWSCRILLYMVQSTFALVTICHHMVAPVHAVYQLNRWTRIRWFFWTAFANDGGNETIWA